MQSPTCRTRGVLAHLLLLALPLLLLGDSIFTARRYLPFDLAEFAPVATTLTKAQLQELQKGCNYDPSEPTIWFEPELREVREALAEGNYPHWNPYVRGGEPLVAHGLMGLLDPIKWPMLLCSDPASGLLWTSSAMFALAGLLMFGLLRSLSLAPSAALFGAVAFAWSGTLVANGHWYMRMEPLALLPGLLWALVALDRAEGARRGLPAAMFALQLALTWSASFPPFAIPCTLFCGLFTVALAVRRWREGGAASAMSICAWAAFATALGLCIAGAHVLQQAMFFPVSNRPVAPTLSSASRFALDPMGLLGLVLPDAFSHPGDRVMSGARSPLAFLLFSRTDWETGALLRADVNYNYSEYAMFPGTLPLLLAIVGLVAKGPKWRWLAFAGFSLTLLLAIGAGPFRYAFALPGIGAVPPYRFAGLACVFLAILAGLGADRVLRGASQGSLRVAAAVALVLGGICLTNARSLKHDAEATQAEWLEQITEKCRPLAPQFDKNLTPEALTKEMVQRAFFTSRDEAGNDVDLLARGRERLRASCERSGWCLYVGAVLMILWSKRRRDLAMPAWMFAPALALTAVELWQHGHPLVQGRDTPHALETPVHAFLREQRAVHAQQGGILVARANPASAGDDPMHLPPGTLAKDDIRDLHVYTYVDKHSSEPIRALYGESFMIRDYLPKALPDDERLALPWWDAIGLRYLLTTQPMQHAGKRVGPELKGENGEFFVYERTSAMPRAWVVPSLRAVGDDAAVVRAAIAKDFAPRNYALVTDDDARTIPPLPEVASASQRAVRFLFEDHKRLTLEVDDGPLGYLVLADTWLPGWTVTCDGEELPIARGNVCMRIVPLPAKACRLEFRYRTPGLLEGLAVTGLALLIAAWLLVRAHKARAAAAASAA